MKEKQTRERNNKTVEEKAKEWMIDGMTNIVDEISKQYRKQIKRIKVNGLKCSRKRSQEK